MSRSRKKRPITGVTCAESEKEFKQQEHQRERAAIRTTLANYNDVEEVLPHPKEFGNPWSGPKDGKIDYTGQHNEEKVKRK